MSTEEAREATPTAESATESVTAEEAVVPADPAAQAASDDAVSDSTTSDETTSSSSDGASAEAAAAEVTARRVAAEDAEASATDNVEIPKQQSAEEAADNEVGESVRK
ncbi:hypothetical protein ACIQM4_00200 [Streptomyces sp. NPDC091272]|uniref:hypothetical protein n=1 Tax=Streptomyces sp. NPDC091272 TaxID=3365981 RepID=UPI0038176F4D